MKHLHCHHFLFCFLQCISCVLAVTFNGLWNKYKYYIQPCFAHYPKDPKGLVWLEVKRKLVFFSLKHFLIMSGHCLCVVLLERTGWKYRSIIFQTLNLLTKKMIHGWSQSTHGGVKVKYAQNIWKESQKMSNFIVQTNRDVQFVPEMTT